MNRYKLVEAGIDVNDGIQRFCDSKEMFEEFLLKFLEDDCYDNLIKAINEKDVEAAFIASHSLKGVAGNLSLVKLYKSIFPLVELFRAGSFDGYEKLLEPVIESYNDVITIIKESQK